MGLGSIPGWEDLLEKGKATHSSILAWRIPCTVQSMGSQRVRHNLVTFTSLAVDYFRASLVAQMVKNSPAMQETWVQSLGQEDPLEKGMATHSSILTWRIPWTEEPARLQSMGLQKSIYKQIILWLTCQKSDEMTCPTFICNLVCKYYYKKETFTVTVSLSLDTTSHTMAYHHTILKTLALKN